MIETLQLFVERIYVGQLPLFRELPKVLYKSQGMVSFSNRVIEGTDVGLVASLFVTLNMFVLLRVIQALHSRVTLVTFEALWALIPTDAFDQGLAVIWLILKDFRRAAEVSSVVRVDARL